MIYNTDMKYKATKHCIGTYSEINIPIINKAKRHLNNNYGNIYDTPSHLTYNISPIPKNNSVKVTEALKKYIIDLKPFHINLKRLKVDIDKRFIYVLVESNHVYEIHLDFVKIMNNYRNGFIRKKDKRRLDQNPDYYTTKELLNIQRYGYARVHSNFIPHLTIGKIAEEFSLNTAISDVKDILTTYRLQKYNISAINILYWTVSEENKPGKDLWDEKIDLKMKS
jgi:hypothetical protein